jgi:hypothetical protein
MGGRKHAGGISRSSDTKFGIRTLIADCYLAASPQFLDTVYPYRAFVMRLKNGARVGIQVGGLG